MASDSKAGGAGGGAGAVDGDEELSDIGLYGLAVMGQNLALNIASKGFKISVCNRSPDKVRRDQTRASSASLFNNTQPKTATRLMPLWLVPRMKVTCHWWASRM